MFNSFEILIDRVSIKIAFVYVAMPVYSCSLLLLLIESIF